MFSVIIPLYNKEESIAETLNSVLSQSYKQYEVIVVDDGSTDNSLAIALSFSDPRIKIFSKENGGVSHARNYGIAKAKYQYISFLDADDFWEDRYLEEMCLLIDKYPDCGMFSCTFKYVKQNKVYLENDDIPEGKIEDYFKTALSHNRLSLTSATIIKKEIFEKVGMFPVGMISGEDSFMWCKAASQCPVAFCNKALATYNLSMSDTYERIGSADSCSESWYDLCSKENTYKNQFVAFKAIENGLRHAWGGHINKSTQIEKQFWFAKKFKDKRFNKRLKKLYLLNRLPIIAVKILLIYKKIVTHYSYR